MVGRPRGTRLPGYDGKRLELIQRIRRSCLATPTRRKSVREIASECGASVPTLKHYFGDRRGIVHAVLEQSWLEAAEYIGASKVPAESLACCVERELNTFVEAATEHDLYRLHAWGITEGLADTETGPVYLRFFLEPVLQAAEVWLAHYQRQGEIAAAVNLRFAALALYSPCLMLYMHQKSLGGESYRPANIREFVNAHASQFLSYLRPER